VRCLHEIRKWIDEKKSVFLVLHGQANFQVQLRLEITLASGRVLRRTAGWPGKKGAVAAHSSAHTAGQGEASIDNAGFGPDVRDFRGLQQVE
jgi:hypothetical protein